MPNKTGMKILDKIEKIHKQTGVRILMTTHQSNKIKHTGSELDPDSADIPIPWFNEELAALLKLGSNYRPTPTPTSKEDQLVSLIRNALSSYYATIKRYNTAVNKAKTEKTLKTYPKTQRKPGNAIEASAITTLKHPGMAGMRKQEKNGWSS
jgi:hypothetical protein